MTIKNYLSIVLSCLLLFTCSNDDDNTAIKDDVLEFVFFENSQYAMNELANSTPGNEIELQVEMLANPRAEDIVLTLSLTNENAEQGVDYDVVSESNTIVIPAGLTRSTDGFKLKTINNNASSVDERKIFVTITAVSDSAFNIGERPTDPENAQATVNISDDECSDTIALFNNAEWTFAGSNTVYYSDYSGSFVTTLNGDQLTITGDIANYDLGITLTATLVPNPDEPTTGTIIYNESTVESEEGYDYRWLMAEEGTYDICGRTIELSTLIQYTDFDDPSIWVDWYVSTIVANLTGEGGDTGPVPPSGSVISEVSVSPGEAFTLTGTINDAQGLSSISIQNSDLGIAQDISLTGDTTYELNETFTIADTVSPDDYSIDVIATNVDGLSATFTSVLSVISDGPCTNDYTVFGNETLSAAISFIETDGSFEPYETSSSVTTTIDGDQITLTGDIIDFFELQLTLTMVPNPDDATIGAATFTIEDLGTYTDGFNYRLVQVEDGTYDACEGTLSISYDLEFEEGGNWVFFYRTETQFNL
jgi:hypothetical protein